MGIRAQFWWGGGEEEGGELPRGTLVVDVEVDLLILHTLEMRE